MAKIAFFEIEEWEKDYIRKKLKEHELLFFEDMLDEQNAEQAKGCEAIAFFIYTKMNRELLAKLSTVKFLTTMSTGFDHIDLEACKERSIQVCNVPFYGENTVAEHTFALILALSRKIVDSVDRTREGDFSLGGLRGFDLKGKTLGVVGGGHIGMHVVKMAKAFEMNVLVFDVHTDKKLENIMGFKYADFNELIEKSDIVTLHAPYTKQTHHMINSETFRHFKKGAYLVNTARGGLIETEALVKALEDGTLAGAALDVLEEECFIKEEKQLLSSGFKQECDLKTMMLDHMLLRNPRVLITPHNAFNSQEALLRILDTTIDNIQGFYSGKIQNSVINKA